MVPVVRNPGLLPHTLWLAIVEVTCIVYMSLQVRQRGGGKAKQRQRL